MDDNEWTFADAEAHYDNPLNKPLCETCGWTVGMACPECPKGCGCSVGCTGWRHHEYRHEDEDHDSGDGGGGCECGAGGAGDPYGECVCYAA